MQTISTLNDLDAKLAECDRAQQDSDDALRRVFASFRMDPAEALPPDPFSAEYAERQFALYRHLAGRPYEVANEVTQFDLHEATRRPFPYSTQSATTTADQYTAIGALLRHLNLPAGSRVLEFGPGWGNTTMALALLGYEVTAVDIEPRFCQLIERRAALHDVTVEVVQADFHWIEGVDRKFDAAIFFECFHHASDHRRLLRALRSVLVPEGRVLFCGEPISPDFPVPWGLRMDGQSLWSIRKHGWLELGFQEGYFAEALASEDWLATKHCSGDTPLADVWEARQYRGEPIVLPATDGRIVVPSEQRDACGISLNGLNDCWGFHGPYLTLPAGEWHTRLALRADVARQGRGVLEVCAGAEQQVLARRELELATLADTAGELKIVARLPRAASQVEVRLYCVENVSLGVSRIELCKA